MEEREETRSHLASDALRGYIKDRAARLHGYLYAPGVGGVEGGAEAVIREAAAGPVNEAGPGNGERRHGQKGGCRAAGLQSHLAPGMA